MFVLVLGNEWDHSSAGILFRLSTTVFTFSTVFVFVSLPCQFVQSVSVVLFRLFVRTRSARVSRFVLPLLLASSSFVRLRGHWWDSTAAAGVAVVLAASLSRFVFTTFLSPLASVRYTCKYI